MKELFWKLLEGESDGDYGSRCELSLIGYVSVSNFYPERWRKNVPNGFVKRKCVRVEKVGVDGVAGAWNYVDVKDKSDEEDANYWPALWK
jgi:hypothetical protein